MENNMPTNMPMHGERELPEFYVRQEDLPEILKWEVGGKYYLVVKVEMSELEKKSELEEGNDSSKFEAKLKVKAIRALDDKPVDAKMLEKEDFNRMVMKVRSGSY